ncbi:MAG: DUF6599 family protein [Acidobacteriota bacterium]
MQENKPSVAAPFASILPAEISGWRKSVEDQVFDRDNVFDYMDGAGEIYLAFDFRFVFVREYAKTDAPSLVVEIYQMSSSQDAFGVFTQDTDGDDFKLGQGAIYAGGLLRFWKNTLFVRILADQETPEAKSAVLKLGEIVASSVSEEGEKPSLLSALPSEGLEAKSLRYFHTLISVNAHYFLANVNVLNLSPETEIAMARYDKDGARARLLLIGYPSTERAFDADGRFVEMFLLERFIPDGRPAPKKLENGKFAGVSRQGRFLIIVLDADKKSVLEWLTNKVSMNL